MKKITQEKRWKQQILYQNAHVDFPVDSLIYGFLFLFFSIDFIFKR